MRIVAARFNHETNTFSPAETPLASFAPLHGGDALAFGRGSATALGAFIDYAQGHCQLIFIRPNAALTRARQTDILSV